MTEINLAVATPCGDCRYLTEPAVGDSEELGEIRASLRRDGSVMVHLPGDCGSGIFQELGSGIIESQSPAVAREMARCAGPFTEIVHEPRKILGFPVLKKKVTIKRCGSLCDGDITRIVENAVLHPVDE